MTAFVTFAGSVALEAVTAVGSIFLLWLQSLKAVAYQVVTFRFRFRETLEQCYSLGVQSLPVIAFSLVFISLMLVTEFSYHMRLVLRQDSLVPAFSTVLLVRELGPTVTCLLLTSRVGAGIAAEIGTMRVTEQIDTLRLLAVDPVEYLLAPRWLACVFASTVLATISLGVAIFGAAFLASLRLGYTPWEFFNTMFVFTHFSDLLSCLLKAATFGTLIPMIAAYHGFHCKPGSRGVGDAATAAVVHGSVLIIAADFVLTYALYAL